MRFANLATLVSGVAASAIPAAAVEPLRRRIVEIPDDLPLPPLPTLIPFPSPSPSTCASYVTVTEPAALLTETETQYVTVTAETVTSIQTTLAESTLETTNTATITQFETSFVTETATVATETATREPAKAQRKIAQRKQKKRGDSCKRRSSSSTQASATSSSATSLSSADVCTATVTAAALKTITTVTITGSTTATDLETVTSVVVATITTTVSTKDLETTAVPTTLPVTATTFVTSEAPPAATASFYLKALSGSFAGKYVSISEPTEVYKFETLVFNDLENATPFGLNADGSVVAILAPDYALSFDYGADLSATAYMTTQESRDENGGLLAPASCQLFGDTTVGSMGEFECANGGSLLNRFGTFNDRLEFIFSESSHEPVELQYIILGDPAPMTPTTPTDPTPEPPPPAPTFVLRARSGFGAGQYVTIRGAVEAGGSNNLVIESSLENAAQFTLDDGDVVLALNPDHTLVYHDGQHLASVASLRGDGTSAACQLVGDIGPGSQGSFTCPNGDSGLSAFATENDVGRMSINFLFDQPEDTTYSRIEMDYLVLPVSVEATPAPPQLTPAFILTGFGGGVNGQVVRIRGDIGGPDNSLVFDASAEEAVPFRLRDDGSLVPASLAADPLNYGAYYADSSADSASSTVSIQAADAVISRAYCQLSGSSTDVGSTGFFTCPNNGAAIHDLAEGGGYVLLENEGSTYERIQLRYTFV
ncbi:hypothetical protein PG993_010995 [Apiospora rasikravindrae]|uniref:Uncharacterized protein n=1 Tax=Apiospora rasikravindrae TaxID=990691 RepID=A0ABR1SCZ3_9PEZI